MPSATTRILLYVAAHVVVAAVVTQRFGAGFSGIPADAVVLGATALVSVCFAAAVRWCAAVRVGHQKLLLSLSALPTLAAALWLSPTTAVIAVGGGALLGRVGRHPVKSAVNALIAVRATLWLALSISLVSDPFADLAPVLLLAVIGALHLMEHTEISWFVRMTTTGEVIVPGPRERVAAFGVGFMVDAVALCILALAANGATTPVLALPPLGLLFIALWAFNTYARIHDAQRHLLAVTRRLFQAEDVEEVLRVVFDDVDTVLPVARAAIVVENQRPDASLVEVWAPARDTDPTADDDAVVHREVDELDAFRAIDLVHHDGHATALAPELSPDAVGAMRQRLGAPFRLEDGTRAMLAVGSDGATTLDREDHRELLHSLALQVGFALSRVRLDRALSSEIAEHEHSTLHDALTGLPNRTAWVEQTAQLLSGSRRTDGRVAVMVLDVSGFSRCNDTLGHDAGDDALIGIASRLAAQLREHDVLARIGPDVFGVTLAEYADLDQAVRVCERLLGTFDEPFGLAGLDISLQARAGLAIAPDHGDAAAVLLNHAEAALGTAKQERLAWSLHLDGDSESRRRRLLVRGALRRSVLERRLGIHLQPKVESDTGRPVGFEALARWEDPELGHVGPDEFVPLAEELGMMPALTCLVLDQALDVLADLGAHGHDLTMAVNISSSAIVDDGVLSTIRDGLVRRGLEGDRLVLELTESAVAGGGVVEAITSLSALGVQVSVDDFGTGYSSLSRLLALAVDELKIDRSFVSAMVDDPEAAIIVRSTAELASTLRMTTVAEGVEHEEEAAILRGMGVDVLQGWLTGRPMVPEAAMAWLEEPGARWRPGPDAEVVELPRRRTG